MEVGGRFVWSRAAADRAQEGGADGGRSLLRVPQIGDRLKTGPRRETMLGPSTVTKFGVPLA